MRIVDLYPSQGCFAPGQPVSLLAEIESEMAAQITLRLHICHLGNEPQLVEETRSLAAGSQTVRLDWIPPFNPAGYSTTLELLSQDSTPLSSGSTSFDVLNRWTDFPRYGFLSDFAVDRVNADETMRGLVSFHINGLQFYDWQYRHDQLLPPADDYIDPLGRPLSLKTVRNLVDSAHRYGIAALPYLAVYGASAHFWRAHPDWALYDENRKAIAFGDDFLGLMDPSADGPWSRHLLNESMRVLEAIPFDGLHIDQYGQPRLAWDSRRELVDLPGAFVSFIQAAREQHLGQAILFNAVDNWPIEPLSGAPLDFMYIEVWPPDVKYRDLARIVLDAVRLSSGKPVVIALYLPADRPENVQLANALILACGGTRIELGEQARLLADPYFPKHEAISPALLSAMRRFYDYAVRDGEWLQAYDLPAAERSQWADGQLNPDFVETSDSIWSVARQHAGALTLQFVNFTGLNAEPQWDQPHPEPTTCRNISVRVRSPIRPGRVCWDCPEGSGGPQALDFEYSDGELAFILPQIQFAGLIHIHE